MNKEPIVENTHKTFIKDRLEWLKTSRFRIPLSWPLFWVVLFAILRIPAEPMPWQTGNDTIDYVNFNYNIFHGETDIRRTPLYPLVIKTVNFMVGERIDIQMKPGVDAFSGVGTEVLGGEKAIRLLVRFQLVIFVLSLCAIYQAGTLIFQNHFFLFAAVIAICHQFYAWQFAILTEGLAISFVGFYIAAMIWHLKKPTVTNGVLSSVLVFLMMMLRPAFVYLLVLHILFWIFRLVFVRGSFRKETFAGLGASTICLLLVLGYAYLNQINYGKFSISNVGTINLFYVIEHTDFYLLSSDEEVREFVKAAPVKAPYRYQKVLSLAQKKFGEERIERFTKDVIAQHPFAYCVNAGKLILKNRQNEHLNGPLLIGGTEVLVIFFVWIYCHTFPWIRLVTWGLYYGLFFFLFLDAPAEFSRLLSPVSPILLIIAARQLDSFCCAYYKDTEDFKTYMKDEVFSNGKN